MFIGKYNKSVIVTYLSAVFCVIGICLSVTNHFHLSICCLILSGICDLFDGKIARMCKNRTEEDKKFGIQIDSLTDICAFVIFPVVISASMGMNMWYHAIIYALYVLGGIIRLAYFNIVAEDGPIKYYSGLPVTSASIIFPLFYLITLFVKDLIYIIFPLVFLLTGFLFIFNFKIKKPKKNSWTIFCCILAIIGIICILLFR